MIFAADGAFWTAGPDVAGVPAVAVLEAAGAVFAWTVDDPDGVAATRMTLTDVAAADWLWQVIGVPGHREVASALTASAPTGSVDVPAAAWRTDALAPLRRLAVGHWARRWWPASPRDGIVGLDPALLDAELALLTARAEQVCAEDAVDAEIAALLGPHRAALEAIRRGGDPRVVELVDSCRDLADEYGVWDGDGFADGSDPAERTDLAAARRTDYALAAGGRTSGGPTPVAAGSASVDWAGVPPGTFDAADGTVDWRVEARKAETTATVRVAVAGPVPPDGVAVRLVSGLVTGAGVLDADGTARLILRDAAGPVTDSTAWGHDWSATDVVVGTGAAGGPAAGAAVALRERVRRLARSRLAAPGADAFLAEIVAAESDY
ncbi:hypothetical protein [Mycolicibacterium grossiae]|uniref:hypothetical protein n=1 Tax=Mycolicibacterium grossiae TaxID=1552759 RepID=UPI0011F34456|nr:hypothetical protein [Mycolicibacterium grossiae]QEM46619.1 hypothetical protein FZ046_19235 [Mycolicibacterium grossiae]